MIEKNIPNIKELREKFDQFDVEMEDSLEDFIRKANSFVIPGTLPLDYSPESIGKVEKVFRNVIEKNILISEEDIFTTKIARYLGEIIRRQVGGYWALCEDSKNVNFGLPWLTGFESLPKFGWSPFGVVLNYKANPKEGLFTSATEDILKISQNSEFTLTK
jgi:hypothetical protein